MLSSSVPQNEFCCQYTVSIVPFLFYASIFGIKNISNFIENKLKNKTSIVITLLFTSIIFINGDVKNFINTYKRYYNFKIEKYNELIKKVKPLVPKNSRIYTDEQLYPYFFEYNTGCILTEQRIIPPDAEYLVFAFQTGYNWSWNSKEFRDFINNAAEKNDIVYKSENFLIIKLKNSS